MAEAGAIQEVGIGAGFVQLAAVHDLFRSPGHTGPKEEGPSVAQSDRSRLLGAAISVMQVLASLAEGEAELEDVRASFLSAASVWAGAREEGLRQPNGPRPQEA